MEKVTGLGGFFIKSRDSAKLREWYREHLGAPLDEYGWAFRWRDVEDPERVGFTQFGLFREKSDYFAPSESSFMLNFRVDDLDAMLAQLADQGVEQVGETLDEEYGRFAWVLDCDGNKIELWQPRGEPGQQDGDQGASSGGD